MLTSLLFASAAAIGGYAADTARVPAKTPPRLTRAESFLGMHFDFHANKSSRGVGATTTPAMVERVIDVVRPDYLQIDCKGHPGISSYPTKVATPAAEIIGDPLRTWREVTARRGVSLYMHYSGVWDERAVELHPEWARVDENGKRDGKLTSVFGPYADELLIPQLRELAGDYGVDGAWIDGECWAVERDWSERAQRLFREKTASRKCRAGRATRTGSSGASFTGRVFAITCADMSPRSTRRIRPSNWRATGPTAR